MYKITSVNAYIKNGKKFVVITTADSVNSYCVNASLVEYALKNAKEVKEKCKN